MPCTVDAEALTKMNENGEITGCIVDGPLSLDLAIEPEAAFHKGTNWQKKLLAMLMYYYSLIFRQVISTL